MGKQSKARSGYYPTDRQYISEDDTCLCLSRRDLKGETDSEIIAEEGQARQTKYYETKILQTETKILQTETDGNAD